jgi:archaellum component FlaC
MSIQQPVSTVSTVSTDAVIQQPVANHSPTLQEQIKELEESYKKLNNDLFISREKIITDERAVLACLQQLMPIQNTFLGNIIQSLQKEVNTLKDVVDTYTVVSEPVNTQVNTTQGYTRGPIQPQRVRSRNLE